MPDKEVDALPNDLRNTFQQQSFTEGGCVKTAQALELRCPVPKTSHRG
jgi:hypothetical protein